MYLIIAIYNHAAYKKNEGTASSKPAKEFRLVDPDGFIVEQPAGKFTVGPYPVDNFPNRAYEAQEIAINLFGANKRYESVPPQEMAPTQPVEDFFTFVGAFPYTPDSIRDTTPGADEKRNNNLFGWVAIVPDDKLEALKERMGWPNGPFCQVFDIMISQITPEDGKIDLVAQALQQGAGAVKGKMGQPKIRPGDEWRKAGYDVYAEQTPTSWSP